jgi:hypothetical protein
MNSDYKENQKKYGRSPAGELNRRAREQDKAINVDVAETFRGKTPTCPSGRPGRIEVGGAEAQPAGCSEFLNAMEEGFSPIETNQPNPFNTPGFEKANSETLGGRIQDLIKQLRLTLVHTFLPSGYEVIESGPLLDVKEFCEQARKFWDAYEPLLGRGNTTTVLQVEAPAELEED